MLGLSDAVNVVLCAGGLSLYHFFIEVEFLGNFSHTKGVQQGVKRPQNVWMLLAETLWKRQFDANIRFITPC